jgi:hypothetical protein
MQSASPLQGVQPIQGPSVSLQPLREGLQFEHNGKTYEITFHKTRASGSKGKWEFTDLNRYKNMENLEPAERQARMVELQTIKEQAGEQLEQQLTAILGNSSLTDDQKTELLNSRSFTLHFTLKYDEGAGRVFPVLNAIFGRAVLWFQDDPDSRLSRLTKITYMPADGAPKKTLKINLEELQGTPEEIVAKKKNLSQTAINIHNLVTQVAKIRPPQQPANPPAVATPPPSIGSAADPNRPVNINNNNNATDSIHQVD